MGISVLHIKTEVECRVYLFDEEKGIAKPGTWFNLEVRKGEQYLLFVSTEDRNICYITTYVVEDGDSDYKIIINQKQFNDITIKPSKEELADGIMDEYGVIYSRDGTQLYKCEYRDIEFCQIKEGCKVIRQGAFRKCRTTSVSIPVSLTHIGEGAFLYDSDVEYDPVRCRYKIRNVTNHSPFFLFQDGCLIDVQANKLTAFLSDNESAFVPNGLNHIGGCAFMGYEKLAKVVLPNTLTYIGDKAFCYCKKITDIHLPSSVVSVGKECFSGCLNLQSISLPNSLKFIENKAFYKCRSLQSITLPKNLIKIGDGAFSYTNIKRVEVLSQFFLFKDGCLIDNRNKKLISFLSEKEEIVVSKGMRQIGDCAFAGNKKLRNINLPNTLTYIGNGAFYGCNYLSSIILSDRLTHIGDEAFFDCTHLFSISLPSSLNHVGFGVFDYLNGDIGDCDFGVFTYILKIHIPKGTRTHFEALLPVKLHSIMVES